MFYYNQSEMSIWQRLLYLLGLGRDPGPRYYGLDERLYNAIEDLAEQEQRPTQEIHADLLANALARRHTFEDLWQRWESLSPREQQIAALTRLGYTNHQIAERLNISVDTVKSHVRNTLIKFDLGSKAALRAALSDWDFSAWDPEA